MKTNFCQLEFEPVAFESIQSKTQSKCNPSMKVFILKTQYWISSSRENKIPKSQQSKSDEMD